MNTGKPLDTIDILLAMGIVASFIVFFACLWLIRRERDKRKNAGGPDVK
jgi:hypothetical protein